MNVITGHAEVLLDDPNVDADVAQGIIDTGQGLTDLADKERRIVDLLVNQPHPRRMDVRSIVDAVTEDVRREFPDCDVSVTVPGDVQVEAIPQLQGGLYELIENSVVHTDRDRSTVELTVEPREETVVIRVADDGPGIPADERQILVGDADVEPLSHGSGLGLWLVHHIVRLSGGTVRYEARAPVGSIVTIEVPRP